MSEESCAIVIDDSDDEKYSIQGVNLTNQGLNASSAAVKSESENGVAEAPLAHHKNQTSDESSIVDSIISISSTSDGVVCLEEDRSQEAQPFILRHTRGLHMKHSDYEAQKRFDHYVKNLKRRSRQLISRRRPKRFVADPIPWRVKKTVEENPDFRQLIRLQSPLVAMRILRKLKRLMQTASKD